MQRSMVKVKKILLMVLAAGLVLMLTSLRLRASISWSDV
jgi:hypothetical protein